MIKIVLQYIIFIVCSVALASVAAYYRYCYIQKETAKITEKDAAENSDIEDNPKDNTDGNKEDKEKDLSENNKKEEKSVSDEKKSSVDKMSIPFKEAIENSRKFFLITSVCFVIFAVLGLIFYQPKGLSIIDLIEDLLLWDSLFLIASIDWKVKKVPNLMILILLAVKGLGLIVRIIIVPEMWVTFLFLSLVGLFVGGFIIFVCILISRGGIGAGDMKLYATVGFFFGISGVLEVMMYSLFIAAITSIVLLISRKAKFKSTIPMAPFVFVGLCVYYLFV